METFCVMASQERIEAGICLHAIPEHRRKRGSHFCGKTCHADYRRQRRQELADRKCRLCGRERRQRREIDGVRSAHTTPQNPAALPNSGKGLHRAATDAGA